MMYFLIILSVILVAVFVWPRSRHKNQKKYREKREEKPSFRSEQDLEKYGKKMEDEDYNPVDFDDAD